MRMRTSWNPLNGVWLELFTGELFALNAAWFRIHCHPTLLLKHCTAVETLHCLQSAIHFATSPCTVCTSEQNIFLMQQRLAMIPHPATSPHSAAAASQDPRTNPFNPTIRITLGPSDAFTPPPLMRSWMHHFCQLFASYKRAAVDTIDIGWSLKFHWNRNLWSFWKVFIGWSTVTK